LSIPIEMVDSCYNVHPLVEQLEAHPDVWDRITLRTEGHTTPHSQISDIWVRYNPWRNFTGDREAFNGPHVPEWYPCVHEIPAAWSLARKVQRHMGYAKLGFVLITRLKPGCEVKPHTDSGWHAETHDKFALQIKGNKDQSFCFDEASLSAEPDDLYRFDNSKTHWVKNESDSERITMIICLRND